MAVESIVKTLGTGSGIDIAALVTQLVDAQYAHKTAALDARSETLTAQVSKISELKSTISDFSTALAALTSGGTLKTQPTSSNASILTVTSLPGADVSGTSASVEVRRLAQGQVASTDPFSAGEDYYVGTGTLTLTFGTANVSNGAMTSFSAGPASPVSITIDSDHSTLAGVVEAINAANAGVTASIVSDSDGARLVVKGSMGESQAFELKGSSQLRELDIGRNESGSTINAAAQDAVVALDGVEVKRPFNTISNLIEGTQITLVSASVGTKVTIGTKPPTEAISQSISNFVDTYNEVYKMVKDAVNPVDGALRRDPAAKDLLRQLKQLTLTPLLTDAATGAPVALADIGVGTTRTGTLSVDTKRVATVLSDFPAEVEAMFAAGEGLTKALSAIAARATDRTTGLGVSEANYTRQQGDVAEDKEDALAAAERMRTRMIRQFASMDSMVSAYKSTQSFLTQQVDAWNKSS